jgi:curved DNA-binding protein CbpA
MDAHFRALGLPRGSTEEELKKTFRKKALEFHPDRNPNGGEMFKKVNTAYEALCKHYRLNGGVDRQIDGSFLGGSSSSTFAAPSRHQAPLFPDEELFTTMDGSGLRGGAQTFPYRRRFTAAAAFDGAHAEAEKARERAHGARKPMSGYEPFHDTLESEEFATELKHFQDMERRKSSLGRAFAGSVNHERDGGTQPSAADSAPSPPLRSGPTTEGVRTERKSIHRHLDQEWSEQRRREAEERAAQEMIRRAEEAQRRAEIDRETREEWERMQREMDQEQKEKRVKDEMIAAAQRVDEERRTNKYLAELHRERRSLKRELFARRMMGESELSRLSELELHVLREVLEQSIDLVSNEQAKRSASAQCVICSANEKDRSQNFFLCGHTPVCRGCGHVALCCPVCGGDTRDENL